MHRGCQVGILAFFSFDVKVFFGASIFPGFQEIRKDCILFNVCCFYFVRQLIVLKLILANIFETSFLFIMNLIKVVLMLFS